MKNNYTITSRREERHLLSSLQDVGLYSNKLPLILESGVISVTRV